LQKTAKSFANSSKKWSPADWSRRLLHILRLATPAAEYPPEADTRFVRLWRIGGVSRRRVK